MGSLFLVLKALIWRAQPRQENRLLCVGVFDFRMKTHEVRTLFRNTMLNVVDGLSRPGVFVWVRASLAELLVKGTHFVHFCARASVWLSLAAAVGGLVACASKPDANQVGADDTRAYIAVCRSRSRFCGCGVLVKRKMARSRQPPATLAMVGRLQKARG